jgi:hypothetical protein
MKASTATSLAVPEYESFDEFVCVGKLLTYNPISAAAHGCKNPEHGFGLQKTPCKSGEVPLFAS